MEKQNKNNTLQKALNKARIANKRKKTQKNIHVGKLLAELV